MEQVLNSLTDRGVSGYKRSSTSLCKSLTLAATLAAELFLQNK
jgi:hypothetical protein